jgi:putative transposase
LEETKLRHRLREIAAEHIRWGRQMVYRLLQLEGLTVNHKRVQRLWREEGLYRPTPRKQKQARPADGSMRRQRAEHPHQVWAMYFQVDASADGRRFKFLNVIDEHSRLCLASALIRSNNDPEFIAQALRDW